MMLVHICCAVDSHYFLQKLREDFPGERLVGFFYDPNIHPYSEYHLRLLEVRRSCRQLGVELIEGPYDTEAWLAAVRGLEHEPEKGRRCAVCFDRRFEVSAAKAAEIGERRFTSTLLTSPKKSLEQLRREGERLAARHGLEFVAPDYRKASGTQEQNRMAREAQLYRQDYCGCLYGLTIQRAQQQKLADELFTPLSRQVQPESIEERIALYEKRIRLEENGIPYRIVRERFLNWRLLHGLLRVKGRPLPAHILPYSTLKRGFTRGKIRDSFGPLACLNRDEVKFVTLERYNDLAQRSYRSAVELLYAPPPFDEELSVRRRLLPDPFDLSTLLTVEELPSGTVELRMESRVFEDVRERLVSGTAAL
jgi:predicted adenine nucleotide alpha hydrolase (AANH) superfamily ATPase